MAKVVAFSNQKGGVGKTTTCINMSAFLANRGYKVLLVDIDPQGNSTSGLGVDKKAITIGTYDAIIDGASVLDAVCRTPVEGLDILPSSIALAGAEIELVTEPRREYKLKSALAPVLDKYDYITIDTPPSLGLLTINALTAASGVLIPIQSEFFALEGLSQLLNSVKLVKAKLNSELEVDGIIVTMFDSRSLTAKQISDQILQYFGKKIFTIAIPRNVRLSEAPSYGVPIMLHDRTCAGAKAYEYITDEFLKREYNKKKKQEQLENNADEENNNG